MRRNYSRQLHEIYEEIHPHVIKLNSFAIEDLGNDSFSAVLLAAFVKSFEFNLDITKSRNNNNFFYFLSFLRGICEDLISLKFLLKYTNEDRNKFTLLYMNYLLHSSIRSQTKYFDEEKIVQPILRSESNRNLTEELEAELKKFWHGKGYNKEKIFPSVEHMAIDSKLKKLYDFLYHATSRAVHFSPNVLLRTGWYDKRGEPIVFSNKNFSGYYRYFTIYYGTLLFTHFGKAFKKELKVTNELQVAFKRLKKVLEELGETPEIITYEEMNFQRPDKYTFKVLHSIFSMEGGERKLFFEQLPELIIELQKRPKRHEKLIKILTRIHGEISSKPVQST